MADVVWHKVAWSDFESDLKKAAAERYTLRAHQWKKRRRIPWDICSTCGLLALRNEATQWCIKTGCNYQTHQSYKAKFG